MIDLPKYLEFTDRGNTRKKFLQELLLEEQHKFLCSSRTVEMDGPKSGCNLAWGDSREKIQLITQMLNELPDSHGGCIFYGRILNWIQSDSDCFVCFEVSSPERELTHASIIQYFKIVREIYDKWVNEYDEEIEQRRIDDVPTVVRAKVKKGCIYSMEWEDRWS